jgi:hypothetical protein
MNQRKIILIVLLAVASIYTFVSCGGTGTATGNDDSGTVTEITTVGDIPLSVVDPSSYDASMASASFNALQTKEPEEDGKASRGGCEAGQQRDRIIREAKFPKMMLCYMQKMSETLGLEFGDDKYNYYKIGKIDGGPDETGGSMDMKVAVKKSDDTITMLMCENDVKVMEFQITAGETYKGHIIDKWTFEEGDKIENLTKGMSHTDKPTSVTEARHLKFDADGDPDDFTKALFTQAYDSSLWGFGSESLEATPDYSTVWGFFKDKYDGKNFSGSSYARFDTTQGTAKYSVSGEYPADKVGDIASIDEAWYTWLTGEKPNGLGLADDDYICCDQEGCEQVEDTETCTFTDKDMESFDIAGEPPIEAFTIRDSDSAYAEFITDATTPEIDSAPSIDFTSTDFSDCSATTWSELTGSIEDVDVSECMAIEETISKFYNENSCEQLEQIEEQKEKAEEKI